MDTNDDYDMSHNVPEPDLARAPIRLPGLSFLELDSDFLMYSYSGQCTSCIVQYQVCRRDRE